MLNRKKALKPYYKDFVNKDEGFYDYIVASMEHLRKQGNQDAKDFPLKEFMSVIPHDIEPDKLTDADFSPRAKELIVELMDKFGFQIFADMMGDMGFSDSDIEILVKSERDGKAKSSVEFPSTAKTIPGFNDKNMVAEGNKRAEFLYNKTLEVLGSIIQDALEVNNPSLITPIINKMNDVLVQNAEHENQSALEVMTELKDATEIFVELVDDERTTVEEYESFQNKLINFFIKDEVEETNASACKDHEGHDPEECDFIKKTDGGVPLEVIYKRIHAMDGTNGNKSEAIPSLALIVLDTVRGVVTPITFSIHEAMTEKTGESFVAACKSEDGTKFILETLMEYRKGNEEKFDRIVAAKAIEYEGEDASLAAVAVRPEVITPTSKTLRALLDEVRETFDVDAAEAFKDISPEDFFK